MSYSKSFWLMVTHAPVGAGLDVGPLQQEECLAKLQLVIQCDNKKQSGLQKHPQFSGGEDQDKSLENAPLIKRLQFCFLLLKYCFVTYE